jgi:hypothetical protein
VSIPSSPASEPDSPADARRLAEDALRRFGYQRVRSPGRGASVEPAFWVRARGPAREAFPVFVQASPDDSPGRAVERMLRTGERPAAPRRRGAIVVVRSDRAAEEAWRRVRTVRASPLDEVSILVVPSGLGARRSAHWHAAVVEPNELGRLATGVVVGLFRRATALAEAGGSAELDFEEMLAELKTRFRVDVHRSLGVRSDEDALFILYQIALRDAYAPGEQSATLHQVVLTPSGPASRLPWFSG